MREYNREYRRKIKEDPEMLAMCRQYAREYYRKRYRDDPEYRRKMKQRTAEYHKREEYKERRRPWMREYMRRYRAKKKAVSTLTKD